MSYKAYSLKLINAIESGKINSKQQLNKFKLKLAEEFSLKQMPSNPDILAFAEHSSKKLVDLLSIKPVRNLSGIAVVAVMTKPFDCPGKCIYCTPGIVERMPKSYTGKEPASLRARMFVFNAFKQASSRIKQIELIGQKANKIELIVMGGTFPSTPLHYQRYFVRRCLDAITEKNSESLAQAKKLAEKSRNRVIGITFETRPDFCGKKEINRLLSFGGTRVELGVQSIDDEVYKKINRGHSVQDVIDATALLKDSAFKVCYHLMPGIPFSTSGKDLSNFKKIFSDSAFKPDMLKIYPTLVIEGTKLFDLWKEGGYKPLSTEQAVEFLVKLKEFLPKWVRVMRVQRDIPVDVVSAGVNKSNLRQLAQERLKEKGLKCRCIRCREVGLRAYKEQEEFDLSKAKLLREDYDASNGREIFLSFEDPKKDALFGFCRLRIPSKPFRKEISDSTALIRELHVYSPLVSVGEKPLEQEFQHSGLGKSLLAEAEKIASEEFDSTKLLVISGLGVKPYYYGLGFKPDGVYVSKRLYRPINL